MVNRPNAILFIEDEALVCPVCETVLNYFSGLGCIPAYLYCPECNDVAYHEENGEAWFLLV